MFLKINLEKFSFCFERCDNRTDGRRTKYNTFTLSILLPLDVLSRAGQTCASMKLQGGFSLNNISDVVLCGLRISADGLLRVSMFAPWLLWLWLWRCIVSLFSW